MTIWNQKPMLIQKGLLFLGEGLTFAFGVLSLSGIKGKIAYSFLSK